MPDPIGMLRNCVQTGRWSGMGAEDNEPERRAYTEALAQVEALVRAAQETHRVLVEWSPFSSRRGKALAAALAPFTEEGADE